MLWRNRTLVVFLLAVTSNSPAAATLAADQVSWDFEPLQYADIVVRGTVTGVSESTVPTEDFWVEPKGLLPPRRTRVLVISINVEETLRGSSAPHNWSYIYWSDNPKKAAALFPVGKEMLVCAKVHPRLGSYYYSGDYGQYVRNGARWDSGPTERGQRSFDDDILRQQIREATIEQVAAQAELVVVGVITSINKSSAAGPDGSWAERVTLSMDVEQVRKGKLSEPTLDVVMLTRGAYSPSWRRHVPSDYVAGQRWLCFVRHNQEGWYPFAGSNGLLRIENEHLVYDETRYWRSSGDVDRAIRSTRNEVDK